MQLVGCNTNIETNSKRINNHSFSNYVHVKTTHLNWTANINFDKKIIEASAVWHFNNFSNAKELILDTKDLQIVNVVINNNKIPFTIDSNAANKDALVYMGQALHIPIATNDSVVTITYNTTATAKALQWLTPQQTADKKMPYLFTQCEAIACRSIIPCQDAPAVRITYNAAITVPKGMMAVMSADNPQTRNAEGKYNFVMDIPVPSYLIALAVGDIDFKAIDGRSGVYAEPSVLAKAATELSDIPNMISAAEKIAGPYFWKRYDVLIQPPSFPIGGMENPKLTFATPTILAGDKSLVSLVAHELAHSWSGNTVTNATWDDVWLNEGFTTYFERRIMEEITDTTYTDMLWELSYQDMMADVTDMGDTNADTRLHLNMNNRDPEDAFTNIPYEKGAHLLWLIEKKLGRKAFDQFMIGYFTDNKFKPMTTEMALDYMDEHLWKGKENLKKEVDIEQWVHHSGIPNNCPRPGHTKFDAVDALRSQFTSNQPILAVQTATWSTHEWLQFLRKLPKDLSLSKMNELDKLFKFTSTKNSEIAFEWYMLSLQTKYTTCIPAIENFLMHVGRKKFVKPIYTQMMKDKEQSILAKNIFAKAKNAYHPATTKAVEEIVH
jgi:leukotriene-A4 hydrolase